MFKTPSEEYRGDANKVPGGRRELNKERTREAIEKAAWPLFERKGFDATTVEEICDAADVSVRTFFRYFDSKEAVLFGKWRDSLDSMSAFIAARPPQEHPLASLRELGLLLAHQYEVDPRVSTANCVASESNTVGHYERYVVTPAIEGALASVLALRLGIDEGGDDPRPAFYAAVAVSLLVAAKRLWAKSGYQCSLVELVETGFDLVQKRDQG